MSDKLKPCPFCGNDPIGPEPADSDWWIECEHCEIVMDGSKAELIKRWNTRFYDQRIKTLESAANSWDMIWNKYKDHTELKEVSKELVRDGCYSCPNILIEFIERLLKK
jgi:Lar family restriction alleviation protein